MSPERLLQGHRAKAIATAVSVAEFLGGQGVIAQNPTPEPETGAATIQQTQIIGELPFNLYASIFLMIPGECSIPPGAEPTPNTLPTTKVNTSVHGLENPAPSIVLARQTLSDGSTQVCALPNEPTTPDEHEAKPKKGKDIIKSKKTKKSYEAIERSIIEDFEADPLALRDYESYMGETPAETLKRCAKKGSPSRFGACGDVIITNMDAYIKSGKVDFYDNARNMHGYIASHLEQSGGFDRANLATFDQNLVRLYK